MCYSAQIEASYRQYTRLYGADISLREFVRLYWERQQGAAVKIPKALDTDFMATEARAAIEAYEAAEAVRLEQELFKQRARLVEAERKLEARVTKAATESRRIALAKMQWCQAKLADLRRTEPVELDARIFPGWYAPVMVMEAGRRVVKPMRYQCRPFGKPASFDTRFPGTYNARRDSLGSYWKELYGHTHGVIVMQAFYENVPRHRVEHRELREGEPAVNVVLEFRPQPAQHMLVAWLWSRWSHAGEALLSCAAITDDPPPEIAATGHDRCIVPIKPEHLDAWLTPEGRSAEELAAILDDRATPCYEHRLAA